MLTRRRLLLAAVGAAGAAQLTACGDAPEPASAIPSPTSPPTAAPATPSPTNPPTAGPAAPTTPPEPAAGNPRQNRLQGVASWLYQLQNVDPEQLATADFDLAVIDYADDDGAPWPPATLSRIKQNGLLAVAYLSIGEAESYRPYWDPAWDADEDGTPDPGAPTWLLGENPDWAGNYRVAYADPDWQALVFEYLDAILLAGFDGVYLDIVDAYESAAESDLPAAAAAMAGLVADIAGHARARDPGFLVFPQNAPAILGELDPDAAAAYLAVVDGIGAEDSFYFGDDDEDNPYEPQTETLAYLDRFVAAGRVVLAVDYLSDPDKISRFRAECRDHGFIPFAAIRELNGP
jgi:cysteinyl-tRNA synthetase, unknown class